MSTIIQEMCQDVPLTSKWFHKHTYSSATCAYHCRWNYSFILLFFIYLSLFIYICLQAMLGIIIILIGCFHSLLHVLLMMLWSISCKSLYWLSSLFSKQFVLKQEKST